MSTQTKLHTLSSTVPVSRFVAEQLVQKPKGLSSRVCTTTPSDSLTKKTMHSLRSSFHRRGHSPSTQQYEGLRDMVSTMEAMALGTSKNTVYLSSLDPGIGKTSAVIFFIQELISSPSHDNVSVMVCAKRLEEVKRLVDDLQVDSGDIAVLTSDPKINALGRSEVRNARVLITTHQMVSTRCRNQSFVETTCFHYLGYPREVRVWDEEMLPGDMITLDTDQLKALPILFRSSFPSFSDFVGQLADDLFSQVKGDEFEMPDVQLEMGVDLSAALGMLPSDQEERHRPAVEALYAMAGKAVRLSAGNGRVVTALDIRDALPKDFAPVLVLDASGRVRYTYEAWEKGPGGLTRLKDAPKNYEKLNISVLERGGGK